MRARTAAVRRRARVILGESAATSSWRRHFLMAQSHESFREASLSYADNPTALHLRAMNMLFEGLKEKGALVIVPSSAVDTMNLGGIMGTTAVASQMIPKS